MFFGFLWPFGALKLCIRDVFEAFRWDLILPDEVTRVGRIFDSPPHALEEPPNLIGCGRSPCLICVRVGVIDQLPMFQHFARLYVHHR